MEQIDEVETDAWLAKFILPRKMRMISDEFHSFLSLSLALALPKLSCGQFYSKFRSLAHSLGVAVAGAARATTTARTTVSR